MIKKTYINLSFFKWIVEWKYISLQSDLHSLELIDFIDYLFDITLKNVEIQSYQHLINLIFNVRVHILNKYIETKIYIKSQKNINLKDFTNL